MKLIEIPLVKDRDRVYRWFERVPGILSWSLLALPAILSLISTTLAAYFVLVYLLLWVIKAIALNVRMIQGYKKINEYMAYEWSKLLNELDNPKKAYAQYEQGISPSWHLNNIKSIESRGENRLYQKDIYNAVIIAVYNETRDIIEPTLRSIIQSSYNLKKLIVIIAYEERGGIEVRSTIEELVDQYKHQFYLMEGVEHPKDIANEVIGKGGNITFAGRRLKNILDEKNLAYENVIVTTLDSDNRPHPEYFAALTYAYIACPDYVHTSFQPISMFTNNIWDVPAPMRVIATGNSFWNIVLALRPHMLRNFASHSQSMQTLIDTDFWSVRTIVEDGHQYWRTYFTYDGNHDVHPILIPIYQDAVLSSTYTKTLKAQFIQVRRWAWGASDIAYVLQMGWRRKNRISKVDLFMKTARLIEGHVSWATASLLLLLGAFVPLYLSPHSSTSIVAHQLPIIASRIQTFAMVGMFIGIYLSIRLLPPKPPRYKTRHRVYMILQWVYLPVTTIVYSGLAALYSQTRLLFGRYLGKFDVTEKAVKK
jgi:hypothetical protein